MTRFLYIADTHLGASPMGYQQQKGYPERLREILSVLCECLSMSEGIDFILHGGDMIDSTTEEHIVAATNAFDFAVPVYLCLGNHDLTTPDAAERWLELAPQFFINGKPDYTVGTADCMIHVAPNHWCAQPFYWKDTQRPHLSLSQTEHLKHELDARPDLPHVLLTHSSVYGLPVEQTGLPEPYHCPDASFTADVSLLAKGYDNLKCVLGAHNHMNMRVSHDGVEFATVSALAEVPFEFKLFEVTPRRMAMSTISLGPSMDFDAVPDPAKSFVQGREADRSFDRTFAAL